MSRCWVYLLATLFVEISGQLNAQNYQCFNPSRIYTFTDPPTNPLVDKTLNFIKVDTVINSVNEQIATFRANRVSDIPFCFECNELCISGTAFGSHMLSLPDGINVFFNSNGDSIFIHTQANLNDSFIMVRTSTDTVIHATLTGVSSRSVYGVNDTVKTFTLNATIGSSIPVSHPLNGDSIVISKTYGLLQGFFFPSFPNSIGRLAQIGITNPDRGITYPDSYVMNDFEVGDEFHSSGYYGYISETTAKRRIVIGKEIIEPDSIIKYTFEDLNIITYVPYGPQVVLADTTELIATKIVNPLEVPGSLTSTNYTTVSIDSSGLFVINTHYYSTIMDSCFYEHNEACNSIVTLRQGFGLIKSYWYYNPQTISCTFSDQLVYYKKGTQTWGAPINFDNYLGIDDNLTNNGAVKLTGNGFGHRPQLQFNFTSPENVAINIFNEIGQLLSSQNLRVQNEDITLRTNFPSGIYFIQVISNKKVWNFKVLN